MSPTAEWLYSVSIPGGTVYSVMYNGGYNASDPYVGLVDIPSGRFAALYAVTQNNVYYATAEGWDLFAAFEAPIAASGSVAGTPSGGILDDGRLFVSGSNSSRVWTVNLGADPGSQGVLTIVTTNVTGPVAMQYDAQADRLVMLADSVLYSVDPSTGNTTAIGRVAAGDGAGTLTIISDDGTSFILMDSTAVHIVDTRTGVSRVAANFTGAGRAVGVPQWFPA